MSWTKTDHEGQTMLERDGERLKEPPRGYECECEAPKTILRYRDRVVYRTGIGPRFLMAAWLIGFVMGMLLATVLR